MLRYLAACFALLLLAGCGPAPQSSTESEPLVEENAAAATKADDTSVSDSQKPIAGINAENYPFIDGSTANMPLMAHLYAKICGVPLEEAEKRMQISAGTSEAWRGMMWEGIDLIIAYEAPVAVMDELESDGIELEITPLGRDGLVFLVNKENPVESLTVEEINSIYTGKIIDWAELGGVAGPIAAYQRNEDSGSQTMFKKLLAPEPMAAPTELIPGSMGGLIEAIADFDGSGAAIGFSVYYYADLMHQNPNLKLLKIDGVAPSKETIGSGAYPLINDFFVVIRASEQQGSHARLLRDWLISPEGAALLEEANYVPVR
jgi:phosphate transport system substrate-binding protein